MGFVVHKLTAFNNEWWVAQSGKTSLWEKLRSFDFWRQEMCGTVMSNPREHPRKFCFFHRGSFFFILHSICGGGVRKLWDSVLAWGWNFAFYKRIFFLFWILIICVKPKPRSQKCRGVAAGRAYLRARYCTLGIAQLRGSQSQFCLRLTSWNRHLPLYKLRFHK